MIALGTIAFLILVAIIVMAIAPKFQNWTETGQLSRAWALIPLGLASLILLLSCTAIVQAKQEGVLLTFGKPSSRTLDPGLSIKLPWQKVVKIDTTRQTDNYNDGEQDTDHSVIDVRLGNGNVSKVYASVTWQATAGQGPVIYGEFRGDNPIETVYSRLIAPNFKQAVNTVLGGYNPTAEIAALTDKQLANVENINLAPDFDQLALDVKKSFLARLVPADGSAALVKILDVQVSFLAFDDATQNKINQYQDEVQKTIISRQAIATALNQAEANKILAVSIAKDPNVLAARCFDLIDKGAFEPPAGFSCYPGSGSAVVIPSAGQQKPAAE